MAPHALEQRLHNIEVRVFTLAKDWFAAAVAFRFAAMAAGLLAINPAYAPQAPYAVAALAVVAEICSMRSDLLKGRADKLLRLRELWDGLGWQPDPTSVADVLAVIPDRIEGATPTSEHGYPAFATAKPVGVERALENVKESAWWTQQLSLLMSKTIGSAVLVAGLISFVSLVICTAAAISTPSRLAGARAATALLVTMFSGGIIKLAYAYYVLHDRARHAVTRVNQRQDNDDLTRRLPILFEYQNARSTGPLIPDAIYKLFRQRLNRLSPVQRQ